MTGVGLLGCGAIGREIASAVSSGEVDNATLVSLFDVDTDRARSLAEQVAPSALVTSDIDAFLSPAPLQLVIECASPDAVRAHAKTVLSNGKDLLLMSSGALTDSALFLALASLAEQQRCRFMVPSGALGGIDAIRAVRRHLTKVTLTTTKSPRSLQGAPGFKEWETREISEAQVIFEGPAVEAVKLFPANVNVAATLSLAGLGPEKTTVKVVADPASSSNVHEVVAKGDFGVLRFLMELRPHDRNPATSYLAVLSAIEALRAACSTGPRVGT